MAALDRTILRMAVVELCTAPDMPDSVAISEAVEAATELSSEESRPFVNGMLGRIARAEPGRALPVGVAGSAGWGSGFGVVVSVGAAAAGRLGGWLGCRRRCGRLASSPSFRPFLNSP